MNPDPRPTRPGGWVDAAEFRRRLAQASVRLVALRCELDDLAGDLSWLQLMAAGGPDLGDDAA